VVVAELRARLTAVRTAVEGLERPRVFALEWSEPPFNGGHWIPEMIETAGGEAVLGNPRAASVRVSWDDISAADPQVVVFMPCGYDLQAAVDEARRSVVQRPELSRVATILAVHANAYFSRPGPRVVDGVEILASALHPAAPLPRHMDAATPVS
jgi:iron complex transport system substrate-binding protein